MLKDVRSFNTDISIQLMPLHAPKYWILWKHQQLGGEQSGQGGLQDFVRVFGRRSSGR